MKRADLLVANSENCADLWYASGFSAPDEFIYFALPEMRGIVVSVLEVDRARCEAKEGVQVFEFSEFAPTPGCRTPELLDNLGKRFAITEFRLPAYFPVRLAEHLRRAGYTLKIEDRAFFPEREFKTDVEIAAIERSLRTAEKAMRRGWQLLADATVGADNALYWEGEALTSERLRMEVNVAIVRDGGSPIGTITAGGTQGAQPHNAGTGQLYAHTPIVMDIFPRSQASGYWGDLTRTVVKGHASPIVRKAFETVKAARDRALEQLRPGASGQAIHLETARFFEERGFPSGVDANGERFGFFHGLGHGVGLEIHEMPRLNAMPGRPLVPGVVVTVEPGVYHPQWGGMRLEDLAVITDSGVRNLTEIETTLEIA